MTSIGDLVKASTIWGGRITGSGTKSVSEYSGSRRLWRPLESDGLNTMKSTMRKFNIAPENIPSQKESSLPTIMFQGLC